MIFPGAMRAGQSEAPRVRMAGPYKVKKEERHVRDQKEIFCPAGGALFDFCFVHTLVPGSAAKFFGTGWYEFFPADFTSAFFMADLGRRYLSSDRSHQKQGAAGFPETFCQPIQTVSRKNQL